MSAVKLRVFQDEFRPVWRNIFGSWRSARISNKLSGLLGEERTHKFQAHACFVPDKVPVTVVVRDTNGTHCICLSFSCCESDSSRKASRSVDVAHTSVLDEQRLFADIILNTVSLNAA
jgi:hypothetical protein